MIGIIPKNDPKQALRIRRFLFAFASYLLIGILVSYFYQSGILRLSFYPFLMLIASILSTNIILYTVLRSGLNKTYKDPSLTMLQIVVAISWLMVVTYFTNEARGVILTIYMVIFIFGIFKLQVRQFLIAAAYAIISYAVALLLLFVQHPSATDYRIEIIHWIVLATVLPWFSIIGGYISQLQKKIDLANKELEDSILRYQELYENMLDIVILVDQKGFIQMANPCFYKIAGFTRDQHGNIDSREFMHKDDWSRIRHHMAKKFARKEDVKDLQFRVILKDGKRADVECNAKCIKKDGRIIAFQMVLRDITERKRLERKLIDSYQTLQNARAATIMGLAKLAEYRDHNTGTHLERIREYSKIIATALSKTEKYKDYITNDYIEDIYISSILHDIGKVGIPDAILLKPHRLTHQEFEIVKRHTSLGGDALKAAEEQIEGQSFLSLGKEISYHHHERWNGSGYPKGLEGDSIPLSARLVALADVYDALTSDRIYKRAYTHKKAKEILTQERGKHFDPDVFDAFLLYEHEFDKIRKALRKRGEVVSDTDTIIRLDERRSRN
jgi:PAS domain S-box-containing protein